MSQGFERDAMQEMAAEQPPSPADEAFEALDAEAAEDYEAAEEEGAEAMDGFEEGEEDGFLAEDGFSEDWGEAAAAEDAGGALEDAVADAMFAEDSDEFFRRLLTNVRRVSGSVGRGAGTAARVARTASQVAGRAASARSPIGYLLQRLGQYLNQGFDEMEAFEDLADWFTEEEADEALPVLAGIAARAVARPLLRRAGGQFTRSIGRQLVRSATQAARTLVRRQGPVALRALRPITRSVARTVMRRGVAPQTVPPMLRRVAVRVAGQPQLIHRLARPGPGIVLQRQLRPGGGPPRQFILRGPVRITVLSR